MGEVLVAAHEAAVVIAGDIPLGDGVDSVLLAFGGGWRLRLHGVVGDQLFQDLFHLGTVHLLEFGLLIPGHLFEVGFLRRGKRHRDLCGGKGGCGGNGRRREGERERERERERWNEKLGQKNSVALRIYVRTTGRN